MPLGGVVADGTNVRWLVDRLSRDGARDPNFNGGNPQLIPQSKMDAYKQPPKTLPRSPGNEREWLDACKGGKTKPGGNFEFEGPVTETLLLGNVASRLGQPFTWDRANVKVNSDVGQKYVTPERRHGWEL